MQQNTVEIRLELLKKIGQGFSERETVKHLTEKFGITESGAYYHFQTRDKWIGQYTDLSKAEELQFQVFQRYNYVYREASFQYQHCQEHNARIGYLRTMIDAVKCLKEFIPATALETLEEDKKHPDFPPIDSYNEEERQVILKAEEIITKKEHEYFEDRNRNRSSLH